MPHATARRAILIRTLPLCAALVACVPAARPTPARADDPKADSAPAGPDQSTATSAALAWLDASSAGDARAAHALLVDDAGQREFLAPNLRFAAARRSLEAAAVGRFGEAGRVVSGYPDLSARALGPRLKVTEEGDRATASLADSSMNLVLRRIDGRWRVDLSDAARSPLGRRAAKGSAAAADVADEVAAEIEAGKFQTAEEARKAFRERRLARVKAAAAK